MSRMLPALLGLALVVAFGVVEGLWANRWHLSDAPERAAARLAEVPLSVGDWKGEAQELDARHVAKAELTGYLLRRYVNERTQDAVTVLLVCGRAGPVSLHTPDVCYQGRGYHLSEPQTRRDVPMENQPEPVKFWVGQFQKDGAVPDPLRIFWVWGTNGHWEAPDNPRLAFARADALYKLYVIRDLPRTDDPLDKDPALEFVKVFLPQLQGRLFPAEQ
ncbi:MAG: exosortase-associated EpsI family protein [Gemmataceae bacterium]